MTRLTNKYLISVVPMVRVPLTRDQDFYYTHNEKIPFGSLVDIPFGHRKIRGIVISSKSDFERVGGMRIKRIAKILDEELVTRKQLRLAKFISHYYLCPLGITIKHVTPAQTKMRSRQENISPDLVKPAIRLTQKEKQIFSRLESAPLQKNVVIQDSDLRRRQQFFLRMITDIFSEGAPAQILYLVPEIISIASVQDLCEAKFGHENIIILHSKLSKGAFYDAWRKIRNNDGPQVIIATRIGLFAPFQQLRAVFINDAEDISYKQWDMNPRYDARRTSKELGVIHGCPVIFASAAPRIADRFIAEKNDLFFSLPSQHKAEVTLIDMRKEHWKNNRRGKKGHYEPISLSLKDLLRDSLKRKETSLLFINHQGLSSFSICTQCKSVLRCPTCTRALVESEDGTFRCLHCSYQSNSFPSCPTCKNVAFRALGVGTERVEKDVSKLFPKARILRIDAQSMRNTTAERKIYDKINSGDVDIVVGTQMITKSVFRKSLGCIGIIDADAFFGTSDFSIDERAFSHLAHVIGLGRAHNAHVAIQTFSPENQIIERAVTDDYEQFYRDELADRKILHLPPFTHVITMTYRSSNKRHARIMAEKMCRQLKDISTEPSVTITPVQKPLLDKVRGDFRRSVSLFISSKNIPKEVALIIEKCESAWIIDRDPITTI